MSASEFELPAPPPPPTPGADAVAWRAWFAAMCDHALAQGEVLPKDQDMARQLRAIFASDLERGMFCYRLMEVISWWRPGEHGENLPWRVPLGSPTCHTVHNQMNRVLAEPAAACRPAEPEVRALCDKALRLLDDLAPHLSEKDREIIAPLRPPIAAGTPWRSFLMVSHRANCGNGGYFDIGDEGLYRHGPACMRGIEAIALRLLRQLLPQQAPQPLKATP